MPSMRIKLHNEKICGLFDRMQPLLCFVLSSLAFCKHAFLRIRPFVRLPVIHLVPYISFGLKAVRIPGDLGDEKVEHL